MSTNLEVGIIGLTNIGKSALFNAMTKSKAETVNYPFSTVKPNIGIVEVPDARLDVLAEMHNPKKITPTSIKFVDLAGLVEGAALGEGLGNKFLSYIRQVDAICHVVRCFEDENIAHVGGSIDPVRDIEIINTELCLADLETIEKRIEKAQKQKKSGDKKAVEEIAVLDKVRSALENAEPARKVVETKEEFDILRELFLLTMKPTIFVANIGEDEIANPDDSAHVRNMKEYAVKEEASVICVCAKMEAEIAEFSQEDAQEILQDLGLEEPGLNKLIRANYELLGLITFFTAGTPEVRAWTITNGTTASKAAGKIHSDIERGFIRAEIVAYDDLIGSGSVNGAKEKGLFRLEGKEYIMKDGDVTHFRFNI